MKKPLWESLTHEDAVAVIRDATGLLEADIEDGATSLPHEAVRDLKQACAAFLQRG
jgi:hypothetical protein